MDDIFDTVMTSFLAQMDSSLEISKIVSEHGGEKEISEDSIVCGLVYRLMNPMTEEELKKSLERGKDIYENVVNDKCETSDEEEEIDNDSLELRKVKYNNCNCDICMGVRISLLNYNNHEPKDNLEMMFKGAIDNACEKGKLYI